MNRIKNPSSKARVCTCGPLKKDRRYSHIPCDRTSLNRRPICRHRHPRSHRPKSRRLNHRRPNYRRRRVFRPSYRHRPSRPNRRCCRFFPNPIRLRRWAYHRHRPTYLSPICCPPRSRLPICLSPIYLCRSPTCLCHSPTCLFRSPTCLCLYPTCLSPIWSHRPICRVLNRRPTFSRRRPRSHRPSLQVLNPGEGR